MKDERTAEVRIGKIVRKRPLVGLQLFMPVPSTFAPDAKIMAAVQARTALQAILLAAPSPKSLLPGDDE
jgi:hypothetical protein